LLKKTKTILKLRYTHPQVKTTKQDKE